MGISSDYIGDVVLLTSKGIHEIYENFSYVMEYVIPDGRDAGSENYNVTVEEILDSTTNCITFIGIVDELEGRYICHVRCEVPEAQ